MYPFFFPCFGGCPLSYWYDYYYSYPTRSGVYKQSYDEKEDPTPRQFSPREKAGWTAAE